MPIIDDVSSQIKDAMRAREKVRLGALRGIRSGLIEAMKADGSDTVSDETAIPLLRRLAKQRHESIAAFDGGGREEMAQQERDELAVIESFLPSLANEETTRGWVQAAIDQTGASSMRDMGKVMGVLMGAHKAEIDGKIAQKVVKELLG
ncbi:MAG: GatB/YqeY domain-containing protein [Rhodobacterales bacterium]|nr:GatB/YqeY domain-containing protein [Rhodobacterales bacterium]